MAWYNLKKQESTPEITEIVDTKYQNFSSPFGSISRGNLALPYVRSYGSEPYVRFGNDNLYPQLINQMYHTSPLNGAIINFKTNAIIGGGWELNSEEKSGPEKVKEYAFIKRNNLKKLLRQSTKDIVMHGRICIIVNESENGTITFKRVGPEKVRNNADKTLYTLSDDWARSVNMKAYKPYYPGLKGQSIFVYELDEEAGQDYYPIPSYCSSLNSAFLQGEIPFLQKSNLINSIFPSFMLTMAKKFGSEEEAAAFRDTIEKAKGAQEAGRVLAFVANSADQLPILTEIPTNQNDKLFTETTENVIGQICSAHQIDMLIMGQRVPGKLGSGNELPAAYTIFEKNVVMPLREMMTEFANELFFIANIPTTITINDYQIIQGVIIDTTIKPTN
jgi:hypothetical protein